jgi:tetratricopeptide (TPR) repeat protein
MPPSSVEFERLQNDVGRIAEIYGVTVCLIPTITAEADRLILNLQAVDPATRKQLWSDQFQGSRTNYNEVLRLAADGAARALRPGSSVASTSPLAKNSDAELAYQQGVMLFNRYNYQHQQNDFDSAMDAFQRALQLDRTLANAAARIAWLYIFKDEALDTLASSDAAIDVEKWARQALAIDPACGMAYGALAAAVDITTHDRAEALRYALKGVALSPEDAFAVKGLHTISNSSVTLAIETGRESYRRDPFYIYAGFDVVRHSRQLGRASEALRVVDELLRLEPNNPYLLGEKAMLMTDLGRLTEAAEILAKPATQSDATREGSRFYLAAKMTIALAQRDNAAAERAHREFDSLRSSVWDELGNWNDLYAAIAFAAFNRTDNAVGVLTRLDAAGFAPPYDWLMLDPRLESLRKDPRLQTVINRSRSEFQNLIDELNEARKRGEFPRYFEKPLAALRVRFGM